MTHNPRQHVIGHHIYTNVFLADPDLPDKMEADPRRLVPKQVRKEQPIRPPPLFSYGF